MLYFGSYLLGHILDHIYCFIVLFNWKFTTLLRVDVHKWTVLKKLVFCLHGLGSVKELRFHLDRIVSMF